MSHLGQLQRALQAHVIDDELAIAEAIDSSPDIPAATRLKIYSDAYRLRLIDALKANHPVLAQLVGETQFARLAQEYLAIHPSRHYSIRWFGHQLAEFLKHFPDYRTQPWLTELAAWEWKIATAFDAKDAISLTTENLAAVETSEWPKLRLTFHPSVQHIALATNVVAIVKAAANSQQLPPPKKLAKSGNWLTWRQDLTVQYRSLDAAEAAAINAAMGGVNFEGLCDSLARHVDADEVPLRAAGLLRQWLDDQCIVDIRTT